MLFGIGGELFFLSFLLSFLLLFVCPQKRKRKWKTKDENLGDEDEEG